MRCKKCPFNSYKERFDCIYLLNRVSCTVINKYFIGEKLFCNYVNSNGELTKRGKSKIMNSSI